MYKSASAAFFVWGILLFLGSVPLILSKSPWGIVLLIHGVGLLAGGIARSIYCMNYNKELAKQYGHDLTTQCFNCNNQVETTRARFRRHRNFPDGYIYCPYCRKPLSIKMFTRFYK